MLALGDGLGVKNSATDGAVRLIPGTAPPADDIHRTVGAGELVLLGAEGFASQGATMDLVPFLVDGGGDLGESPPHDLVPLELVVLQVPFADEDEPHIPVEDEDGVGVMPHDVLQQVPPLLDLGDMALHSAPGLVDMVHQEPQFRGLPGGLFEGETPGGSRRVVGLDELGDAE